MINKIWKSVFVVCAAGCLASCSDQMNYNEYNIFDKDYITQNFGNVGGFMTDIYNTVDYDFGNYSSGAMQASATDESVQSWGQWYRALLQWSLEPYQCESVSLE